MNRYSSYDAELEARRVAEAIATRSGVSRGSLGTIEAALREAFEAGVLAGGLQELEELLTQPNRITHNRAVPQWLMEPISRRTGELVAEHAARIAADLEARANPDSTPF